MTTKWKMMAWHDRSVMLPRSPFFSPFPNILIMRELGGGDPVLRYELGVPGSFLSVILHSITWELFFAFLQV